MLINIRLLKDLPLIVWWLFIVSLFQWLNVCIDKPILLNHKNIFYLEHHSLGFNIDCEVILLFEKFAGDLDCDLCDAFKLCLFWYQQSDCDFRELFCICFN